MKFSSKLSKTRLRYAVLLFPFLFILVCILSFKHVGEARYKTSFDVMIGAPKFFVQTFVQTVGDWPPPIPHPVPDRMFNGFNFFVNVLWIFLVSYILTVTKTLPKSNQTE